MAISGEVNLEYAKSVMRMYNEMVSDGFALFNPWRSMDSAPKDRSIEVYATDPHGYGSYGFVGPDGEDITVGYLSPPFDDFVTHCRWHPDAGFCVCELRIPILWREYFGSDYLAGTGSLAP